MAKEAIDQYIAEMKATGKRFVKKSE